MNEFDLIDHFFNRPTHHTVVGIGDDAAIISPQSGYEIHISTDTLVEGKHFFADVNPRALGYKTLAVNLSDLAAMGAKPRWALLSLCIPEVNHNWLTAFSDGFLSLAQAFNIDLIGGNTVQGPLALTVTIMGEAPIGENLQRHAAQAGDDLWVSGQLGLAALAVYHRLQGIPKIPLDVLKTCQYRLDWPEPRVALGQFLRGVANACVDISDGLLGDLEHILLASQCGAALVIEKIPTHPYLMAKRDTFSHCFLSGGDDYELLFTAPANMSDNIGQISQQLSVPLTCIGHITAQSGLCLLHNGQNILPNVKKRGFNHFIKD